MTRIKRKNNESPVRPGQLTEGEMGQAGTGPDPGWGRRVEKRELLTRQHLRTKGMDYPGKPPSALGRARPFPYLDQSQDVTAVRGSGWTDLEFGHFRLLLFFPLRTRPLYLNSRRRWFLIRLPGASSSQSGWHHDPANLTMWQKTSRLGLGAAQLSWGETLPFMAAEAPPRGRETGEILTSKAARPQEHHPLFRAPPSSGLSCDCEAGGGGGGAQTGRAGQGEAPGCSLALQALAAPRDPSGKPECPRVP